MKDFEILDTETIEMVMGYLTVLGDSLTSCMSANNERYISLGYHDFCPGFNLYGSVMTKGSLREALKIINLAIDYLIENSIIPPPIPDELEKWSYLLNVLDMEEMVKNFFEARDKIFSLLCMVDEKNIIDQISKIANSDDYDKKLRLSIFLRAICISSLRRSKLLDFRLGKDIIKKLGLGIKGGGLVSYIIPPIDDNEVMVRRILDPHK